MVAAGGDGGRPAEHAGSMTGDYLKAVAATLSELRRHCRRHGNDPARGISVPARLTGCVALHTGGNAKPGRASNAAGCHAGLPRWRARR